VNWRDYSVIKLFDIQTGNQTTVTRKSKYFTPDISPAGQKIVAVEIADNGKSELHVLDAGSGEIKSKIDLAEVNLFTDPKFLNEDSIVTAIRLRDGRMTLALVDLTNGKSNVLIPASFNVTGYPSIRNNVVYFTASYGGYDNVFCGTIG
jgi:Tol biopolymer transport system component